MVMVVECGKGLCGECVRMGGMPPNREDDDNGCNGETAGSVADQSMTSAWRSVGQPILKTWKTNARPAC